MWIKALSLVGFPVFVGLYFMAQHAGYIPSPANSIEPALKIHNERLEGVMRALEAQTVQYRLLLERQSKMLSQVCRNTAKTDYQTSACD